MPDPVYFCQEWIIITHKMKKTNEKSGFEEKNMTGKFGITVLGSGSKGNAAVIHGPEGTLLLDA